MGFGLTQRRNASGLAATETDGFAIHAQRNQIHTGGIPIAVGVLARLRRSLMRKAPVPAARQVKIPAAEFLHPRTRGVWTTARHPRHGPSDVEVVAGVTTVALAVVSGGAHFGEELGALLIAELIKQHGHHAVLAVVFVTTIEG